VSSLAEAAAWQTTMRARVEHADRLEPVRLVAGCDASYGRHARTVRAAVVVIDASTMETVDRAEVEAETNFPYVPGYLTFREAPAMEAAFARLRHRPDLLLVDGHGWAHPRRFGIACHLGVSLDLPAIGVGKSLLIGEEGPLAHERGATAPLVHRGEVIGVTLRTRAGVRPVYVSVGHRVGLASAVRLVLSCGGGFRIPEPIRRADQLVGRSVTPPRTP